MGCIGSRHADKTQDEKQENIKMNRFLVSDDVDIDGPKPNFEKGSCIIVVGTTGNGKTTLMNLYTGQERKAEYSPGAVTDENAFFRDLRHPDYPDWLDTIGWNDTENNDYQLTRDYLKKLQKFSESKRVHAIIWIVQPGPRVTVTLQKQAKLIQEEFGTGMNDSRDLWRHVIICCRADPNQKDDPAQGAKFAIQEVVRHKKFVDELRTLKYLTLHDENSRNEMRKLLNQELFEIESPITIHFRIQRCRDCGEEGDERLLKDYCHDRAIKVGRFDERGLLGWLNGKMPKRKICSVCKGQWTRGTFRNLPRQNQNPACVRVTGRESKKHGDVLATELKFHVMEDI